MTPPLAMIQAEIPRLRRFARFLVHDVDRADDLVQDCLIRAISRIDRWQPGTNLRAWLFVILRNVHLNEVRRLRRSPMVDTDQEHVASVPSNHDSHMALLEVRDAFMRLTEEHREALVLVAIEGMPYQEAADILDVPIGTVRSRTARARQALRDLLAEDAEARQQLEALAREDAADHV